MPVSLAGGPTEIVSLTPPISPLERRKEEKKVAKEQRDKQLKAAAKKRAKERLEIAEGANPYINPNRQGTGLPLKEQEDDFMASLLGNLDDQATVKKGDVPRAAPAPVRRSKPTLGRSALSASASKRPADLDATSFRSTTNIPSSSDFASDPASDPFLAPSSDGFDAVKKARFDSAAEDSGNDLGGMDPQEFDDYSAPAVEPLGVSNKSNEDVKMEGDDDDDDLFVKPTTTPAAKPKGAAQRRQLVNASTLRKSTKPETVDDAVPPSPMPADQTPKRKGIDWRTATSALAAASSPLVTSTVETVDESTAFNESHKNVISATGMRAPAQQTNALEPDGSLQFWWFDYDEPSPGVVRLVGKVRARGQTVKVMSAAEGKRVEKEVPKYVSATVVVKGLRRKLYVLPKSKSDCTPDCHNQVARLLELT